MSVAIMRKWNRKEHVKVADSRLLRAAERGATAEVRSLLEKGANVVCFGVSGTPLHVAAKRGYLVISNLLIEAGAPCNILGESNYTPLHLASKGGHVELINLLFNNGASVDAESKFERRSPLHLAAEAGHEDCVSALIQAGCTVDSRDIYGVTPLHHAARAGHLAVAKNLLGNKATVDLCDNDGWSPLHVASQAGHPEIIKLLLQHHASLDIQNKYGRTPLHWACTSDHVSAVDVLLTHGAQANPVDINGKTPLQCCRSTKVSTILKIYSNSKSMDSQPSSTIGHTLKLKSQLAPHLEACQEEDEDEFSEASSLKGATHLEDVELCYDSGFEEIFGQDCSDEIRHANNKYKSFIRTVSGLLVVMESKTDALTHVIMSALEGKSNVSYVDVFKQLYSYLQTIDDSLKDFRCELTSEGVSVSHSINGFMETCIRVMENKIQGEREKVSPRTLHYIATLLAPHSGILDKLLDYMMMSDKSMTSARVEADLDEIDALFPRESDRIFEVLQLWEKNRSRSQHPFLNDVIEAIQNSCNDWAEDERTSFFDCIEKVKRDDVSDRASSVSTSIVSTPSPTTPAKMVRFDLVDKHRGHMK